MPILKIQRIRSCTTCHELLSLKCDKCIKHPERKAKVIELFEWPEVIETGPCGCIKIKCQLLGCKGPGFMWRTPKKNQCGLSVSKSLYCTKLCAITAAQQVRTAYEMVPCLYCRNLCRRTQSMLKRHARVFCHPEHYALWRVKKRLAEQEQKKLVDDKLALLACYGSCGGEITEHIAEKKTAKCRICGAQRSSRTPVSSSNGELNGRSRTYAKIGLSLRPQ